MSIALALLVGAGWWYFTPGFAGFPAVDVSAVEWREAIRGAPHRDAERDFAMAKADGWRVAPDRFHHPRHGPGGTWGDGFTPGGARLVRWFPPVGDFVAYDDGATISLGDGSRAPLPPGVRYAVIRVAGEVVVADLIAGEVVEFD